MGKKTIKKKPSKDKAQPKKVGRPQKFSSLKELEAAIDAYFAECKEEKRPLTVTGLALALDTTRETLMDYQKKPEYSDAIKRAKTRVENFAEERLFSSTPTGAIFALKNFGWRDKPDTTDDDETPQPANVHVNVKDARKPADGTDA